MRINCIFELSMVLDNKKFHEVLRMAHDRGNLLERDEGEYIDQAFSPKGITVIYRNSQYKKKVRVVVNTCQLLDGVPDADRLVHKLEKRITEYFKHRYQAGDFILSGANLIADIDVGDQTMASAYMKVIQRVGKVKSFSPVTFDGLDDDASFCLSGNSNGIDFLVYDLGKVISGQCRNTGGGYKKLKTISKQAGGILRAEVRLTASKAIRFYTDAKKTLGQMAELHKDCQRIFLDTFAWIIPYGDFYKKDKVEEIIRREVADNIMRRRMLRLLALIPEKKSLWLAQKAMNCRNVKSVMDAFAKIKVSPVTISKRQDVKYLKSLYSIIFDETQISLG